MLLYVFKVGPLLGVRIQHARDQFVHVVAVEKRALLELSFPNLRDDLEIISPIEWESPGEQHI